MAIQYVTGDATRPLGDGTRIIVHVCNDIGGWGKGFVVALSKRWKTPEASYRRWFESGEPEPFKLGHVQFVLVEPELWVANVIGQHDIVGKNRPKNDVPPVRYDAIRSGLQRVAKFAVEHGASIHMPRIGAGFAGGDWNVISGIISNELTERGVAVTVYHLPSRD